MSEIYPQLIVGLGNPGGEYKDTPHNVGFMALDALALELGINYWKIGPDALVASKRLPAPSGSADADSVAAGSAGSAGRSAGSAAGSTVELTLAKPLSFMNLSGNPVKGLLKKTGLSVSELLVVHDDMDLPAGTLKLKFGGGHGGHNGLRSINQSVGSEYARLRIGIGRPPGRMDPSNFVLQRLKGEALADLQGYAMAAVPIILDCLSQGLARSMNKHNGGS